MGGVYEKYKLFVMVFMGMCIRVMGVLTTYVYVFFCDSLLATLLDPPRCSNGI